MYTTGEDRFWKHTIKNLAGVVEDISNANCQVWFAIFDRPDTDSWSDAKFSDTLTGGNGNIVATSATTGKIEIHLPDTESRSWATGDYYIWIKVKNEDGMVWDTIKNLKKRWVRSPLNDRA